MKRVLLTALLLTTAAFAQVQPPPVEDPLPLIQEAQTALQAGEIVRARRALEIATRSVSAKNAVALLAFLPAPLDGWTVNDGEAANASMLVLGGGLTLDRTYSSDSGDVRVEILADSDIVLQMSQMFKDTQTIAAMGMQTETIGGETAIVDPDGKYTFLIDDRTLIAVSGSAPLDIRKSYAGNINFAGLKAMK